MYLMFAFFTLKVSQPNGLCWNLQITCIIEGKFCSAET